MDIRQSMEEQADEESGYEVKRIPWRFVYNMWLWSWKIVEWRGEGESVGNKALALRLFAFAWELERLTAFQELEQ